VSRELEDLYRDVILDHHKRPRNFRVIGSAQTAEGRNPLCGDRLTVYLQVEDARVTDASFQGYGCAIATASASLMTEAVRGKTIAEVDALAARFHGMVVAAHDAPLPALGELAALGGVRRFPARVKCASLPWRALLAIVSAGGGLVSTE
jgi:nitrogen fixation protein NifU and related proteins